MLGIKSSRTNTRTTSESKSIDLCHFKILSFKKPLPNAYLNTSKHFYIHASISVSIYGIYTIYILAGNKNAFQCIKRSNVHVL